MLETNGMIPLNLQFFADGVDAGGADEGTPPTADVAVSTDEEGAKEGKPLNLFEMLEKDKALQSQFDQAVGRALATQQKRMENEKNMTAEQLAEAKAQEKLQVLSQREQALVMKELRADALELFGKKGLSPLLIDCVSLTDAASMQTSVNNAEKAFRAAVDAAVKEKLKGYAPAALGNDQAAAHLAKFEAAIGLNKGKQ